MILAFVFLMALGASTAKVYFQEDFLDGEGWEKRWVHSQHKSDLGKFVLSAGKFHGDPEKDKGIKTSQDARFYALSASFDEFSNEGKDLVVQFTVKHEQDIDCGGGYVKLLSPSFKGEDFHGETAYGLMFGPDVCGSATKKVHVIFNYKGENHPIKHDIPPEHGELTHVYTLIVKKDNTYEVLIDNKAVKSGSLEEDWDMIPPKKIKDPEAKKPDDWVDDPKIDDKDDVKPEDWDKPEHIPDPGANKPEDWDDELDGEWEPPMIDNPDYKGEWKPKQIDNPAYKGEWVHPEIDNPEYKKDPDLYKRNFAAIGFDVWQVKSGTIFDNILVCDDVELAKAAAEEITGRMKIEKEAHDKHRDEERKKATEEGKKEPGEDEDDEDEEEEDIDQDEDLDQGEEEPLKMPGHEEL